MFLDFGIFLLQIFKRWSLLAVLEIFVEISHLIQVELQVVLFYAASDVPVLPHLV
jgi:hypothetical protein